MTMARKRLNSVKRHTILSGVLISIVSVFITFNIPYIGSVDTSAEALALLIVSFGLLPAICGVIIYSTRIDKRIRRIHKILAEIDKLQAKCPPLDYGKDSKEVTYSKDHRQKLAKISAILYSIHQYLNEKMELEKELGDITLIKMTTEMIQSTERTQNSLSELVDPSKENIAMFQKEMMALGRKINEHHDYGR